MRALAALCGTLAAVFAAAAAAGGADPGAPAPAAVAITHVTVIDTTGGPPKPDMTVVVQDQRIVDLGKSDAVHAPGGARLIDGSGKYLIPGLWDMHVHEVFGDWIPRDEKVVPPLFVANGITGVRDMGGDLDVLKVWRAEIAAGRLLGPRMIIAGPMLDGPVPRFPSSAPVATPADARRWVDELTHRGVDFIKIQSLIPRDGYFAAADEAKKLGMVFVGHVPDAVRASEASNAGQKSIEHFTGIFEGCSTIEDQLIKGPKSLGHNVKTYDPARAKALIALMAKNQTWQVPTLVWERGQWLVDDIDLSHDPLTKYAPAAWKDHTWPMFVRDILKDHGYRSLAGAQELRANGARHDARHVPRRRPVHGRHRHGGGRAYLPGIQPAPGARPVPARGSHADAGPADGDTQPGQVHGPHSRIWERSRKASSRTSCCSTPIRWTISRNTQKIRARGACGALLRPPGARSRCCAAWRRRAAAEPVPRREIGGYAMTAHRSPAAATALAGGLHGDARSRRSPADLEAKPVTVADLLAGSPAADWRVPSPDDTLYLELPHGRVVIELATRAAPQHAANIKALARAHYFDGLAIIRVQDNYVVQWDDERHRRPMPAGVRPSVEFTADARAAARFEPLPDRDLYAPEVGFLDGFPAGRDPRTHTVWLAHCYGMVGAGRDDPPESDRCGDVCGDRPCAAPARPQRRAGRTRPEGDGTPLDAAARQRRDGFLRRLGTAGAHHLDEGRIGPAGVRAHTDRGAAHRQRDFPLRACTTARAA